MIPDPSPPAYSTKTGKCSRGHSPARRGTAAPAAMRGSSERVYTDGWRAYVEHKLRSSWLRKRFPRPEGGPDRRCGQLRAWPAGISAIAHACFCVQDALPALQRAAYRYIVQMIRFWELRRGGCLAFGALCAGACCWSRRFRRWPKQRRRRVRFPSRAISRRFSLKNVCSVTARRPSWPAWIFAPARPR